MTVNSRRDVLRRFGMLCDRLGVVPLIYRLAQIIPLNTAADLLDRLEAELDEHDHPTVCMPSVTDTTVQRERLRVAAMEHIEAAKQYRAEQSGPYRMPGTPRRSRK